MKILVTGSGGLIGSEAVHYFCQEGHEVVGVDNNFRKKFFGEKGDTSWLYQKLQDDYENYTHSELDIRDKEAVLDLFEKHDFDAVIHCAAQPSHDYAAQIPFLDFEINANGTLHLLEATRLHTAKGTPFCHMSTNKVYGSVPNELNLIETDTRYDYGDTEYANGIAENMRIDNTLHSLFGASKAAADIMVQEYGKYFGMNTAAFRGGCLTGPSHSGVELHGFLNYIVKVAIEGGQYTIFGYKGKQVRDQIHSRDVIRAFHSFIKNPRQGEVYNLGGGRGNSASILEIIKMLKDNHGLELNYTYSEKNRTGDHICYISDLSKMREHFPDWDIRISLDEIMAEIVGNFKNM